MNWKIQSGFWKAIGKATLYVVGGAALIGLAVLTGGTAVVAALPFLTTVMVAGGTVGIIFGAVEVMEAIACFEGKFDIVQIEYTPFAIFSNKVPMFDINFFNPKTINSKITPVKEQLDKYKDGAIIENQNQGIIDSEEFSDILNRGACVADWSAQLIYKDLSSFDDATDISEWAKSITPSSNEAQQNAEIIAKWLENGVIVMQDIDDTYEEYIIHWISESNITSVKEKLPIICFGYYENSGSAINDQIDELEIQAVVTDNYAPKFFQVDFKTVTPNSSQSDFGRISCSRW